MCECGSTDFDDQGDCLTCALNDWSDCVTPITLPEVPRPSFIEEGSDTITPESPVYCTDYESPDGEVGFRASAPLLPGCAVVHRSRAHALRLVATAAEVVHAELDKTTRLPMAWVEPN